jgi:hypothetical protein
MTEEEYKKDLKKEMKKGRISEDLHHRRFLFGLIRQGRDWKGEYRIPSAKTSARRSFTEQVSYSAKPPTISNLGFERIVAQFGND